MKQLKDQRRDNNVDLTRSTMQRKINSLHKMVTFLMESAQRRNRKLSQHRGFIGGLIAKGILDKQNVKSFFKKRKNEQSNA